MMRTLRRNKQRMYYALFVEGGEPIYKYDSSGNKIISYVDELGNIYYETIGETEAHYKEPVEFGGNISMSDGESDVSEFGVNVSDYSAVLVLDKGLANITETSIIWFENEPSYDENDNLIIDSADYNVVKVSPSLNYDKYILKKRVK